MRDEETGLQCYTVVRLLDNASIGNINRIWFVFVFFPLRTCDLFSLTPEGFCTSDVLTPPCSNTVEVNMWPRSWHALKIVNLGKMTIYVLYFSAMPFSVCKCCAVSPTTISPKSEHVLEWQKYVTFHKNIFIPNCISTINLWWSFVVIMTFARPWQI